MADPGRATAQVVEAAASSSAASRATAQVAEVPSRSSLSARMTAQVVEAIIFVPPYDPSESTLPGVMQDEYSSRGLATVTGPEAQTDKNKKFPRLGTGPPPPSLFTLFDAFELDAWTTSPSVAGAGQQLRATAQGNQGQGKGQGKPPKKPKPDKTFNPKKVWILGMEFPVPMGAPPMGPSGLPPAFGPEAVFSSNMYWQDFQRARPVIQPFEGHRPPHVTLSERMRVDWETPLSLEMDLRHPTLSDYQIESDVPRVEDITMDKWYTTLGHEFRTIPLTYPAMEGFVNLTTVEEPHVDSWETPLTRPDPWRPKEPIQYWPFSIEDLVPLGEDLTLDKWYTRLAHPIWPVHHLRLPAGVLSEDPIPDEALLPTRIPWDSPLAHEFNRRRWAVIPPIGVLERGDDPEEILVSEWGTPLSIPQYGPDYALQRQPLLHPWPIGIVTDEVITVDKWQSMPQPLPVVRQLPIALFPFREEGSPPLAEEITLDKWYQRMQDLTRFRRNAVTGPEGQDIKWTVLTAPWIPLSNGSPEPIPDTPGVTYNYWLTAMALPVRVGPRLPVLYLPLQKFEFETLVPECDRPRRRPDRRKC